MMEIVALNGLWQELWSSFGIIPILTYTFTKWLPEKNGDGIAAWTTSSIFSGQ